MGSLSLRSVVLGGGIALACWGLTHLGFQLVTSHKYASAFWAASGFAVVALLQFGNRFWPAVFLGYLAALIPIITVDTGNNAWTSATLISALISTGLVVQAAIISHIVRSWFDFPIEIPRFRDALVVSLITGPIASALVAVVVTGTLVAFSVIARKELFEFLMTCWAGGVIGSAIFSPALFFKMSPPRRVSFESSALRIMTIPMMALLLISVGLTALSWQITKNISFERYAASFATLAHDNEMALIHRIETYNQALNGAAGLFKASDLVTGEDWATYVETLNTEAMLPGIMGIGLILPVEDADLDQFTQDAVADGFGNFRIHPDTPVSENFIIRLIEPFEPNAAAHGLNIAFESNRYDAAVHARDTGQSTITRRIILVQDGEKGPGFLLLKPLYRTKGVPASVIAKRKEFWGWVYAPFAASRFLSNLTPTQGISLNVSIYDGPDVDEGQLIYSSTVESNRKKQAMHTETKRIAFRGQLWTVVWQSTSAYEANVEHDGPTIVLVAGSALSIIIASLWLLYAKREAAINSAICLVEKKSREIERSEERFRLALQNAPNGMALVGLNGEWLSVNQNMCAFFGLTKEGIYETNAQEITHPGEPDVYDASFAKLEDGSLPVFQCEKQYIQKDGSVSWGLLSISDVRDAEGNVEYFILQILDITERKEIEKVKGDFIAVVSHELRTPLTSIRGSLGLVNNTMATGIPDVAMRLLDIAHKNCERLIVLINDILDLEKLTSGDLRLDIGKESVNDLVGQAVEVNQAYADQYGVKFKLSNNNVETHFEVDQLRLHQVLSNLMSNAAKFSPENGEVTINVENSNKRVRISVIDNGPGIPPDFRKKIFGKFSQADASTTRAKGGTGLGLHISKELVENMGGHIGFESEVGRGSVFWIDFPLLLTTEGSDLDKLNDTQLPVALHIEDDKDFSEVLSAAMKGKMNFVNRTTFADALAILAVHHFDVLIIDEGLPDGHGLDLLKACSKGPDEVKVVVISAQEQKLEDPRIVGSFVKARATETEIVELLTQVSRNIELGKAA